MDVYVALNSHLRLNDVAPRNASGGAAARAVPPSRIETLPRNDQQSVAEQEQSQENQTGASAGEVQDYVEEMNSCVAKLAQPSVKFTFDRESGELLVKVIDKETGDVIRQIPPEEMLRLKERQEEMRGLIFSRVF